MEKLVAIGPYSPAMRRSIEAYLPEGVAISYITQQSQYDALCDADYILLRTLRLERAQIETLQKARLIQRWGAGYDSVDIHAAGERKIQVAVGAGVNAQSVAELTVLLMLAVCRNLIAQVDAFAEGKDCFGQIVRHSSGWSAETAGQVRECLRQIRRAFEEKAPGWKEYTAGQIHLLTAALIRGAPARPFLRPALPQDDALRKVLTYLSRHYLEPLTLAECARALGFNPSYLSAMFSQRTGSSFHQYLISLRLKQAEWLLTSGELPISEISAESGFSSDKTFYRTFREHYGKTPGEYRKEQQKR